jgi:hypothetical protein
MARPPARGYSEPSFGAFDHPQVSFYDGHTEHMNKTVIYIDEDFRAKPRLPGMWVVDMKTYNMTY